MQTFFPHADSIISAQILDNRRLGKQRVEALQIASCLLIQPTRWKNHPAVLMWKGYEAYLIKVYVKAIMDEWVKKGFKNDKCQVKWGYLYSIVKDKEVITPPWLTTEFIASHRSNLLRKNKEYYGRFGWNVPDDLNYIWPEVNNGN